MLSSDELENTILKSNRRTPPSLVELLNYQAPPVPPNSPVSDLENQRKVNDITTDDIEILGEEGADSLLRTYYPQPTTLQKWVDIIFCPTFECGGPPVILPCLYFVLIWCLIISTISIFGALLG